MTLFIIPYKHTHKPRTLHSLYVVPQGSSQYPAQHISPPLIRRHRAITDGEGYGAQMVR